MHLSKIGCWRQRRVTPRAVAVTATLSYGAGIDRVGVIHDCAAKNASIVCREF